MGNADPEARASIGGWGLGGGYESVRIREEDDEDEGNWDDAQVIGFLILKSGTRSLTLNRRWLNAWSG